MGCIVFLTLACTAIDLEPLRLEHLCPPFFASTSEAPSILASESAAWLGSQNETRTSSKETPNPIGSLGDLAYTE